MANRDLDDIVSFGSYRSGKTIEIPMTLCHAQKSNFINSLDIHHQIDLSCAIEFLLSASYHKELNFYYREQLELYHSILLEVLTQGCYEIEFQKLKLFTSIDRIKFGQMLVRGIIQPS